MKITDKAQSITSHARRLTQGLGSVTINEKVVTATGTVCHSAVAAEAREDARWRAGVATSAPDGDWTKELVQDRLSAGIRVVQQSGGRVGPRSFGNSMPAVLRDWGDLLAQAETDHSERNRVRMGATSREVTLADQALSWIGRYVTDDGQRAALNVWLLGKAVRKSWQDLAQKRGMVRETAKRRKDRAIHAIVCGLNRDGVQVEGAS